jgi:poly(hydroxyalkanoate) granule-associated protein
MASRQIKTHAPAQLTAVAEQARTVWLAGLGAVSVAQKRGEKIYSGLVEEGRSLQLRTNKLAARVGKDVKAQVKSMVDPLKKRAQANLARTEAAIEFRVGRVLSRLGVPSKSDVDALASRVSALSRQLKTKGK